MRNISNFTGMCNSLEDNFNFAVGERGGDGSKSMSSRSSKGSVQVEVKLPWYMGITFKVIH